MGLSIGLGTAVHLVLGLLIAALPVRVTTTSGETLEGSWNSVAEDAIVLESEAKVVRIPLDSLSQLTPVDSEERTGPATRIYLRGGSRIAAEKVTLEEEILSVQPRRQSSLQVPLDRVSAIRFRSASPSSDPQWLGIMEQEQRGDLLVIRRGEGQLDPVPGVISGIADGEVAFSLGGDSVNAPVQRLEGLRFGGGSGTDLEPAATIIDSYGSVWAATGIVPSEVGESITLRLPGDVEHIIPVDQISSIRWRTGLALLAQQEAAEKQFRPYLQTDVPAELLEGWFGPRVDGEDDLIMNAGSSITYRIEPGFATLAGSVRRDPSVAAAGEATLRILLDDRALWEQTIGGANSLGFELPIENASRVRFEVLPGKDGDVGDTFRLQRPRLLK